MKTKDAIKKIKMIADAEQFDRQEYERCEKILVEAGICPGCLVNDDMRCKLLAWQAGDTENYAGRECPFCEDFFPCGEQIEYNNEPDCFSDADPGL